jgi:hypothetical protein
MQAWDLSEQAASESHCVEEVSFSRYMQGKRSMLPLTDFPGEGYDDLSEGHAVPRQEDRYGLFSRPRPHQRV